MNRIEAVRQIMERAKEWGAKGDGDYAKKHGISKVYYDDSKWLRIIAGLIEKGELGKARECAYRLDTLVRDLIPDSAWDFLQENS